MRALRAARGATARKDSEPAPPAGSSLKSKLAKLGIRTDFDLVLHLPLRYEDETVLTPIEAARHGAPALVEGEVVASDVAFRPRRQLVVQVRDASGVLFARFLNFYQSQARALAPGTRVRLFGEVRPGFFGDEMVHPRYRVLRGPEPLPASLTPVYPTTAGLGAGAAPQADRRGARARRPRRHAARGDPRRARSRAVRAVRAAAPPSAPGGRPHGARNPHPPGMAADEVRRAARAAALDADALSRAARAGRAAARAARRSLARLLAQLPFQLTRAQRRAWGEIERDLARPIRCTACCRAMSAAARRSWRRRGRAAVENGLQAAVMAPTEILAEQHYRKFAEWLAPLGVRVAWLAGALPARERRAAIAAVADGGIQVAIGTHALFQEKVAFARLGLAIVDEQHRFGVRQRLALRDKGRRSGPLAKGGAKRSAAGIPAHPSRTS